MWVRRLWCRVFGHRLVADLVSAEEPLKYRDAQWVTVEGVRCTRCGGGYFDA